MPLARINHLIKTTGFRLALWYSLIFIVSSLLLFALLYFSLRAGIMEKDRNIILGRLNEYTLQEQRRGLRATLEEISLENDANSEAGFFVRVADPAGQTLIVTLPTEWQHLTGDFSSLFGDGPVADGWGTLPWKGGGGALLEFYSRRLTDGSLLQVGRGSGERQKLIEHFGNVFAAVMAPLIFFGFAGGFFLAARSLRPVRDLIQVVRGIDIGKMDTRVPSRQSGDELDDLVRLFNAMLERIEQLITGMRSALDNVAHDLRTPVTRMRAGIETALQSSGGKAEVLREALLDCAEESERIISMLNTLMDISEAETGVMTLHRQPIEVVSLLAEVADLYQYVAEEKEVEVAVSGPVDLTVPADTGRMRQVIGNLLDNSLKYTPAGGRVELDCGRQNGNVFIMVRDTGEGISPNDLPLIFDRLYRGDHSRSRRGLGLGLSLVKAVIHAHAGSIKVESAPGHGSTFTLLLPVEPSLPS